MAREIVGITRAAQIAGVTHPTILAWCRDYAIGTRDEGGGWRISAAKLRRIMKARAVLAEKTPTDA